MRNETLQANATLRHRRKVYTSRLVYTCWIVFAALRSLTPRSFLLTASRLRNALLVIKRCQHCRLRAALFSFATWRIHSRPTENNNSVNVLGTIHTTPCVKQGLVTPVRTRRTRLGGRSRKQQWNLLRKSNYTLFPKVHYRLYSDENPGLHVALTSIGDTGIPNMRNSSFEPSEHRIFARGQRCSKAV